MITLGIVSWLIAIVILFSMIKYMGSMDELSSQLLGLFFFMVPTISFAIAAGIQYDINGDVQFDNSLFLLTGIVTAGLSSIVSFVLANRTPSFSVSERNSPRGINLIFQIIGFVSSILGIISFYLDYLK